MHNLGFNGSLLNKDPINDQNNKHLWPTFEDLELPIKNLSQSFNDLYMCYIFDDELDNSLLDISQKTSKTKLKSFLSRSSSDITTLERKKKMLDIDDDEIGKNDSQIIPISRSSQFKKDNQDLKRSHSFNEEFLRRIPKPIISPNKSFKLPVTQDTLLPCFTSKFPQYYCIDGKTLCQLIDGYFSGKVENYIILDCRYEYEYCNGHIRGSLNINDPQCAYNYLFSQDIINKKKSFKTTAIIIHCEFSSERGPRMYDAIREYDRKINSYPFLFYPEIYLLDGGYAKFFKNFKDYCDPCGYTTMKDKNFRSELKSIRKEQRRRSSLSLSFNKPIKQLDFSVTYTYH